MKRTYYAGMSKEEQDEIWQAILDSEKLTWKEMVVCFLITCSLFGSVHLLHIITKN